MAYTTPKTDWATGDIATATLLNNIGNNLVSIGGAALQTQYARCTADTTVNASTALVNVTGCAFTVAASETWAFWFYIFHNSGTTPDIDFALSGPSSPTAIRYGVDGAAPISPAAATAFATRVSMSGQGFDNMVVLAGLLRNGANSGTVQLRMSQNVSNATNTTVYTDTFVYATRVA